MLMLEAQRRTREEIYGCRERGQGWMEAADLLWWEDPLWFKGEKGKKKELFSLQLMNQKRNISSEICSLRCSSNLGTVWTVRYFICTPAEWCTWFTARCFPAFPHWRFSPERRNRRQLSGVSLQRLYILHGVFPPQVVKYRHFISTLCSSGSELCVCVCVPS